MLSAGLWWAGFTLIPYLGLRHLTGTVERPSSGRPGSSVAASLSCGAPSATCADYPQTMLFLLAYLFFNDGIQTVIGSSSVYGAEELGFSTPTS